MARNDKLAKGAMKEGRDESPGRKLAESTRFLLLLFLMAVGLRSFIIAPFNIPSGSMLPQMMIGDYLFVTKWTYGYSRFSFPFGVAQFEGRVFEQKPRRGDVVVFRYPGSDKDFVKRLIGLPGDRIQVREGRLRLDGKPIPRVRIADYLMPVTPNSPCRGVGPFGGRVVQGEGKSFCAYRRYRETLPGGRSYEVLDQIDGSIGDNTPVYVVPEGQYFVLGDNRDDSLDSRFSTKASGVGFLPDDNVIGEAAIIFFSTDGSAEWLKPWTWLSAARWDRIGDTY